MRQRSAVVCDCCGHSKQSRMRRDAEPSAGTVHAWVLGQRVALNDELGTHREKSHAGVVACSAFQPSGM
jgi:hypothetical protein